TNGTPYSGTLTLTAGANLAAIAYGNGYASGSASSAVFVVNPPSGGGIAAAPSFSPDPAAAYTGSVQVTLASVTANASIRYTTDGATPTRTSGTFYSG